MILKTQTGTRGNQHFGPVYANSSMILALRLLAQAVPMKNHVKALP
jgi:hypothetical protein